MTRHTLIIALALAAAAACKRPQPGDPLPGLTAAQRAQFDSGRAVFDSTFTAPTGLGPLFNASGCGECHEDPVVGGVGDEVERHAAVFHPDRPGFVCDQLAAVGGPVFQDSVTAALHAALGIDREPLPPGVTTVAARTTPDIFGFGLLDAVPDSVILSYADPDDKNGDGIMGTPSPTPSSCHTLIRTIRMATASWAVPIASLTGGSAVLGAKRSSPRCVSSTMAPSRSRSASPIHRCRRDVFTQAGCAGCHIPVLRTGDNPIAALSHQEVAAYSDLLLHDMGEGLADICFGLATPSEFRTEPLMGLRFSTHFLHDGRAATPEQAIDFHGGEATRSRDLFRSLPAADRAALLVFLKTL